MIQILSDYPRLRKAIYIAFIIIGVAEGAMGVAYRTIGVPDPIWLAVADKVTVYLSIAVGLVAATNLPKPLVDTSTPEFLAAVKAAIDAEPAPLHAVDAESVAGL